MSEEKTKRKVNPKGQKRLSLKQKRFVKHYLETGNLTEATIRAGYNTQRRYAGSIGAANLQKPRVQEEIKRYLSKAGLDESYISETLKEMIEAGKLRKITASDALKAIHMVLKLQDAYPTERKQITQFDFQAKLQGMTIGELQEKLGKVKQEREDLEDKYGSIEVEEDLLEKVEKN